MFKLRMSSGGATPPGRRLSGSEDIDGSWLDAE